MVIVGTLSESNNRDTLSQYDILDTPQEPVFDDIVALATHFCGAPISLISFIDGKREWFKARCGIDVPEVPMDHGFACRAIRSREVVVVSDVTEDDELRDNPLVKEDPHVRFFAGCPLLTEKGDPMGALYVLDREPHELTSQQKQMLRVLSHEVMLVLELRRETHENRSRNASALVELEKLNARLKAGEEQHRLIEERLQRREQQLADAQRITHLGSWEWDLRTNSIAWSDELYRIYGVKPGSFQATYAAFLEYIHPEDRGKVSQAVENALVSQTSFAFEERIVRADGAVRVLSSHGEVIRNEKGEPVRMVGSCHDITERKQIEDTVQRSLSVLHAALESTADGILIVDLDGHIVRYNNKFATLWHIPAEVVKLYNDHRLLELVLEQLTDPQGFLDKVNRLYDKPELESFDVVKFKDGRTFERFSCPQRLGEEIVGRVWSFRDVTDRVCAIKVLQRSEERYRSLIAATAQIVWTTNPRGDAIEDSPSWRHFTGQTFEQMRNRGWLNALHPRDRRRVCEMWDHALGTGAIYHAEFRLRRADGMWRHVTTRGVPVRESDGSVREWIGYCLDITDRKEAEEAIVKERDFSEAIINSLPGIFYLLDETGLNLRWNQNLEHVTGYSASEISNMRAIEFVPEDERVLLAQRVHKVFAYGEADVELNLLTKSGQTIPYYCTGKLVHMDGQPRLIGMGIDISARKYAEAEIKRLNSDLERRVAERTAQLRAANKELESFSYTASHDLRSPIRAIIGFAGAIQEDLPSTLEQEHRDYLQRIIEAGDRMMQLIDDLLNYCQVGRQSIHFRSVALVDVLRQTAQDFAPRLKALDGKLTFADNPVDVMADATLLRQVFSNLFENALTYRRSNVPPRIEVSWAMEPETVVIAVSDNGIGIAPEHYERIFEVFQRLHSQDEFAGTGIGLATAKRSMTKLGGEIWVESKVGEGSVFYVKLKRAV